MRANVHSYYMGISCRPAGRVTSLEPSLSASSNLQPCSKLALSYSPQQSGPVGLIHLRRKKKNERQKYKNRSPYLERKEEEAVVRNRRQIQQPPPERTSLEELFKVARIATQTSCEAKTSPRLPDIDPVSGQQGKDMEHIRVEIKKSTSSQWAKCMQIKRQDSQGQVFSHFPSPLFDLRIPKSYSSVSKSNPKQYISQYFFPSNRVRTQPKEKPGSGKLKTKPGASPRRKLSHHEKVFNFDGTLENHQIVIPERPQTAEGLKKDRKNWRRAEYLSYQTIADKSVRRMRQNELEKELKILPWGLASNQAPPNQLLDISCSTIREEA